MNHKKGTREEWLAASLELLKAEKELSRQSDELAKRRQELPWVKIDKQYLFETERGAASLEDLFCGRSQLVVYHFMFGLDYNAGCPVCSSTADSFNGVLPHLEARDVTMISISRAPLPKLLNYRQRMGWDFNWASSFNNDFNFDFGVSASDPNNQKVSKPEAGEVAAFTMLADDKFRNSLPPLTTVNSEATGTDLYGYLSEGHGFSVFIRDEGSIYHCYSTYNRGTEFLMGYYSILDRTPNGRDEAGPNSAWIRRHNEYDKKSSKDCCK